MNKSFRKGLAKKALTVFAFSLLVLLGFFTLTKISQILPHSVDLDNLIWIYSFYFSGCFYAYLAHRYYKNVRHLNYSKAEFFAICVGAFIFSLIFTYICSVFISQLIFYGLNWVFRINDRKIDVIIQYMHGAVSCVFGIAFYHIGEYAESHLKKN